MHGDSVIGRVGRAYPGEFALRSSSFSAASLAPWGDPDLQACGPSPSWARCRSSDAPAGLARVAPGRRPCDFTKAFRTEEEYTAWLKAAGITVDRHGKRPEITAEAKRLSALLKSRWALPGETQTWDWATDFDSWDRCITRGMPSSMMPYRYNNGVEITQALGRVILNLEMVHEARVIPVDGRPRLSSAFKQGMGELRGRWEGNTLVIETTNYMPVRRRPTSA